MSSTSTATKQSPKEFYLPYIIQIVQAGQKPRYNSWDTGASVSNYYILGPLPMNKMAIYMDSRIEVISGRDNYGGPIFDFVNYSAQSLKRFIGRNINVAERDLVLAVRELIKRHKGAYSGTGLH